MLGTVQSVFSYPVVGMLFIVLDSHKLLQIHCRNHLTYLSSPTRKSSFSREVNTVYPSGRVAVATTVDNSV